MLAIEEVKTWAVAKARGVQTAATVAATGAQEALNTAMRTNPIGAVISLLAILGTAIYAIVKAITSETEAEKKAREEAENLAKTYQTKYAESLGSTILKYKQMQAEYEALRTEHEKTQWITDNKNKIDELGVAVKNVSDAERFFYEDTDNVVRAFMLRAQAAGLAAKAEQMSADAHRYDEGQEISPEDMNKFGFRSNGRGRQTVIKKAGTFSNHYYLTKFGAEEANKQVTNEIFKKVESMLEETVKLNAEANSAIGNLSNKVNQTVYEQLQQQRDNYVAQKRALSEADAAGKAGDELQQKIDAIDKRLEVYSDKKKTTGGNGNNDNKDSANRQKQLEDEWKYQEELKKIKQEGADAAADAEIASEQDAALREQKMRKEQHERKIRELNNQVAEIYKAIYEQRKKAYESENKGKYTDTTAGALGWGEEAMKGTLTDKEREYFMARYAVIAAGLAEEKAVWARYEQEREREHVLSMRDFLKEYGNELEQELAITQDYQEKIDKARAEGDKGKALMLERKMQEALSDAKLKNLKKSTDYVRAFENLSNASSDTLKSLITKFEAAKESAAQNLSPDQLREYTSTLQQMYDEMDSRNPFDTLVKSLKELAEAQKELKSAQGIYDRVMAGDTVINDKTGQAYTEEEATRRLTEAKDNEARVYTRLTKATASCASRLNSFADTLSNLGNMVGGKLGKSLGALGGVLGSVGSAFDNIKSINVNATGIEKTMGQISAVAGTVSAMIEMNKQLDSILPDQESLYEYYAAKQSEINKKRQQLLELEIAQMNERLQNEHWFYENGLTQLKKNAELNAEYLKTYGEIAAAPQEVYKEAKSGFSKWAPAIIGAIVGIVVGVLTFGAGAGAGAALGAAIGSAVGGTAVGAALGSTVIAMIGTAIFSGVGAALGNAIRAGIDGIIYDSNQTAALNNMRVQTRHKTFFRSEKTQDLESWVKENWNAELFDKELSKRADGFKVVNVEVAKKLLEEGPTLVGETRETLEKLMEYSEKIREFIEQIHEYVSQAFSPLLDNLVDALWDWLSSGKDVLDSFREYAADTFKNIAQDALKAMANKLIFEPFQEQLENLTIAYATNQEVDGVPMDETAYMAGVAAFAAQAQQAIEDNLPLMKNAAEVMQKAFEAAGIHIVETSSSTFGEMRDLFKNALLEMEGDAEDFSKNIKKILYEKLVERFVMNTPMVVNIEGQDTVFKDLDEYLDSISERYSNLASELTPDEYDRLVKEAEDKVAAQEAAIQKIKNSTDSTVRYWNQQYSYWINRGYGYLMAGKGEENMNEQELNIYRSMQTALEQINKAKAEGAAKVEEETKKLEKLRAELEEIKKSDVLTDEERIEKEKELQAEIDETLKRLQNEAKRYADMSGWTVEQKIDASPLANIGDSLLSALQDTSKGVDDWKKEIVESMTNDLIKEIVYNDDFKNKIRALQEQYVHLFDTDENGNRILSDAEIQNGINGIADALAGLYGDAEKATEGLKELVPDIDTSPFDNLRNTFLETLMDMESGAEKFRDNIIKTLTQDLIEKLVLDMPLTVNVDGDDTTFDNFDKYSEKWNSRYTSAIKQASAAQKEIAAAEEERRKAEEAGDQQGIDAAEYRRQLAQERYNDAMAYIDSLIDELVAVNTMTEDTAKDFKEKMKKAQKDTTFTDMSDSFVSALMDMNTSAEDWAETIGKTMAKKIIEQMVVANEIQPLLDDLQKAFDTAMSADGATYETAMNDTGVQAELDKIKEKYPELQALAKRIMEALGVNTEGVKEGFSDLRSSFVSALMDMKDDAESFGKSIGLTMAEQMLDSYLDKNYKKQLDELNGQWADALAAGDTAKVEEIKQAIIDLYAAIGKDDTVIQLTADIKKLDNELDSTFKDMGDDWVSVLLGMDYTAADFGRQIGQTLVQKIVKEMIVSKELQTYLDAIQDAYNEALGKEGATWQSVLAAVTPAIDAAVAATEHWKPIIEEISKAFKELDNTTPLDNIRSMFLSQLIDMKSDTKDFAKSITEILTEAFIDKFVLGEEFNKRLEEWQKEYASIMGGNYSEEERANLLKQLRQAITAARDGYAEEAKIIHDFMGTANYDDQQATMNMADKITYEQADMLLGINMAQELTLEQILATLQGGSISVTGGSMMSGSEVFQQMYGSNRNDDTVRQILETLRSMSSITAVGGSDIYGEQIFNRLGTTNDYLLAIRDEVRMHLGNIAMYTSNLVKL